MSQVTSPTRYPRPLPQTICQKPDLCTATLRTIRAVINRCPIGDTPYRAAPALADGALFIRSPSFYATTEVIAKTLAGRLSGQ